MVYALVPLDESNHPIAQDICGEPTEVLEFQAFVQAFINSRGLSIGSADFAHALAEKVRMMWGGIQTAVVYRTGGATPRFIFEVETWSRELLGSELNLDGDTLEQATQEIKQAVWARYGGEVLYFRKTDPLRNLKILNDWEKNSDFVDLARKWNLTTPNLYNIINRELKKRQSLA